MKDRKDLKRKGLDVGSLLTQAFPSDLTLLEARNALLNAESLQGLWGMAKSRDRIRIEFGWRYADGQESFKPDHWTIADWKNTPPSAEVFLAISDGEGGVGVSAPEPELVG